MGSMCGKWGMIAYLLPNSFPHKRELPHQYIHLDFLTKSNAVNMMSSLTGCGKLLLQVVSQTDFLSLGSKRDAGCS